MQIPYCSSKADQYGVSTNALDVSHDQRLYNTMCTSSEQNLRENQQTPEDHLEREVVPSRKNRIGLTRREDMESGLKPFVPRDLKTQLRSECPGVLPKWADQPKKQQRQNVRLACGHVAESTEVSSH